MFLWVCAFGGFIFTKRGSQCSLYLPRVLGQQVEEMQGQFASLLSFSARPCVILCDLITEESPLVWHPGCVMQQRRGHWHKEHLVFKDESWSQESGTWVSGPSIGQHQTDFNQPGGAMLMNSWYVIQLKMSTIWMQWNWNEPSQWLNFYG